MEVLDLTRRSGPHIQGSDTFPWGSGLTVDTLEYIIFLGHVAVSEPSTWCGRALFTTRLEIAAWVSLLHTVERGTPISGYRQRPTHARVGQQLQSTKTVRSIVRFLFAILAFLNVLLHFAFP
jgi:hypothetical protein